MKTHIAHLDSSILVMQEDMSKISTKLDTLPHLLFNISEMNWVMLLLWIILNSVFCSVKIANRL